MNKHSRILIICSGILGAASVIVAGLGAHLFYDKLLAKLMLDTFDKAVDYTMYGALIITVVAGLQQLFGQSKFFVSGYLFFVGTLLFSGSLFGYTIFDMVYLTPITPWGGTTLVIAWLSLGIAVFGVREKK